MSQQNLDQHQLTQVILGLGSNIEPLFNLRCALSEIKKINSLKVLSLGSIYESEALLLDSSQKHYNKPFLNSAVLVEIEQFEAMDLLKQIKDIEKKLKRISAEKWAPRTIDIDILWTDGSPVHSDELTIPHKELTYRPFALLPALDVYPQLLKIMKIEAPQWMGQDHLWPLNCRKSISHTWPKIVAIMNLTNDSFSDGGLLMSENDFINKLNQHFYEGAEIFDFGAESTRPGAIAVDDTAELMILKKYLKIFFDWKSEQKSEIGLSIDSRKFEVHQDILSTYPVDYINDVSGFEDHRMLELLKIFNSSKAVCMHSITVPPQKDRIIDENLNAIDFLIDWWVKKIEFFNSYGIDGSRFIFDPGIGFGKSPHQNFEILNKVSEFSRLNHDIYIGHSRKSFLKLVTDRPAAERDPETAKITAGLNQGYVQYLRVHNVLLNKKALLAI